MVPQVVAPRKLLPFFSSHKLHEFFLKQIVVGTAADSSRKTHKYQIFKISDSETPRAYRLLPPRSRRLHLLGGSKGANPLCTAV